MMILLYIVATILILICVLVGHALVASVNEMSNPETMFGPFTDVEDDKLLDDAKNKTHSWATYHGFDEDIAADFTSQLSKKTIKVSTWRNSEKCLIVCLYVSEKGVHYDLVSEFTGKRGLTTSSSAYGAVLPSVPKNFLQYFPGMTLNELWQRHTEAEEYIKNKYSIVLERFGDDTLSEFKDAIVEQMKYIKSLFLWQLRGPYWYFFWYFLRKKFMLNRKVSERY